MTKREFVEHWILRHATPHMPEHEFMALVYNANLVWDWIGKEIAPEPEKRSAFVERLFGP